MSLKQRFSIRKTTLGVGSVLLGCFMVGHVVQAAEEPAVTISQIDRQGTAEVTEKEQAEITKLKESTTTKEEIAAGKDEVVLDDKRPLPENYTNIYDFSYNQTLPEELSRVKIQKADSVEQDTAMTTDLVDLVVKNLDTTKFTKDNESNTYFAPEATVEVDGVEKQVKNLYIYRYNDSYNGGNYYTLATYDGKEIHITDMQHQGNGPGTAPMESSDWEHSYGSQYAHDRGRGARVVKVFKDKDGNTLRSIRPSESEYKDFAKSYLAIDKEDPRIKMQKNQCG